MKAFINKTYLNTNTKRTPNISQFGVLKCNFTKEDNLLDVLADKVYLDIELFGNNNSHSQLESESGRAVAYYLRHKFL